MRTILSDGNLSEGCADLTFIVMQTEMETTMHYQAYVEFRKAVDWSKVKAIFSQRVHIDASFGTAAQNIRYCTKVQTRYTEHMFCLAGTWGTAKAGGNNTMCAIEIQNGASFNDIDNSYPAMTLLRPTQVRSAVARAKGHRNTLPKMIILFGLTGCGKSRYVFDNFGGADKTYWVSPPESGKVWFGGYSGQDVCVFDDFHDGWFQLTKLLRIMDRYPVQVCPKGDQVPFNSGKLIFTSNVDPRKWYLNYKGKPAHKEALERRIKEYVEIIDCTSIFHPLTRNKWMRRSKRTASFSFTSSSENFSYNTERVGYQQSSGYGENPFVSDMRIDPNEF